MARWLAGGVAAVLAALLVAGTAGCGGGPGEQATVRVAAASDLRYALDEVVDGFTAGRPEVRVEVSYGSSGALFQQLVNGAPYDLYLSADGSYVRRLVDLGLADPADAFGYAVGRLVVWAPDGSPVDPDRGIAAVAGAGRVAIANPEHAPYGGAAVAALRAAGLYDRVEPRLVLGESVAQAAEFAASGNAEVALVAASLALSPPLREAGRWQEVPPELYPRLDQAGVVLAGAAAAGPARSLRDHLTGVAGAAVLERYGFGPPES
jgi:molybdate transport system substrate-binding protein